MRTLVVTAATVWVADLLATALKAAVGRPRPEERLGDDFDVLVSASIGSSLPSGHAATSFAGAIVLTALVGRAGAVLFLLAGLVSVSRVYVGAHYPLDVLAGAALGAAVGLAAARLVRALPTPSRAPRRSGESPRAG